MARVPRSWDFLILPAQKFSQPIAYNHIHEFISAILALPPIEEDEEQVDELVAAAIYKRIAALEARVLLLENGAPGASSSSSIEVDKQACVSMSFSSSLCCVYACMSVCMRVPSACSCLLMFCMQCIFCVATPPAIPVT